MASRNKFPSERISWAAIEYEKDADHKYKYSFVLFLLTFLVGGLLFSIIAKVSITVEAKGRLISKNPPVPIRASQKMNVDKVLVAENQKVRKNDLLLVSVEAVDRDNLSRIQNYLQKMSGIVARSNGACSGCALELDRQEQLFRKIRIQGDLIAALSAVQDNSRELALALTERKNLPAATSDLRMQIALDKRKLNMIVQRKAQSVLAHEYELLSTDLVANQTKITEKKQKSVERISSSVAKLRITSSDLRNKIQYLGGQYSIRAPFDGVVVALNLKGAGEVVQVGQELMSLIPANAPLIAELEIRNRDIAEVRTGQVADIKVDSMPEFEYGSLKGRISQILRRERDPASDVTDLSGAKFLVRTDLNQQHLGQTHRAVPLLSGMTVRADIISREESVLHVVVRALFELKGDLKVENEK